MAQTGQTVRRMVLGWILASLVGVALGAVIGVSATARVWLAPMLESVRPLPASAIAPVAVVFLGLTDHMVLFLDRLRRHVADAVDDDSRLRTCPSAPGGSQPQPWPRPLPMSSRSRCQRRAPIFWAVLGSASPLRSFSRSSAK